MVKLVIQHKTASQIRKSPMQAPIYTQDTDTDTFETFYSSHQFQLETVACCQIYDHNQQWKTRANHTGGIWRKRDHTRSQYDFIKFKWFWKGKKKKEWNMEPGITDLTAWSWIQVQEWMNVWGWGAQWEADSNVHFISFGLLVLGFCPGLGNGAFHFIVPFCVDLLQHGHKAVAWISVFVGINVGFAEGYIVYNYLSCYILPC